MTEILADIVLAVADDVDDRTAALAGGFQQHGIGMFDRLRKVGQPADVPFHLRAACR